MTVDLRSVKKLYTSSGVPLKALYHVQSGKKLWSASDGMTVRGTLKAGTSSFSLNSSFTSMPASIAVNDKIVSTNSKSATFSAVAEGANIEIKFGSLLTNTDFIFLNCTSLTSLDLSSFDTSNVTSMTSMFSNCTSLKSLDLSSFDTSNVVSMYGMFNNCASLTSLDLSSFDTSKVKSTYSMFGGINPNCITKVGKGWTSNMPTPPNKVVV